MTTENGLNLTPTQRRIFTLLQDGLPHTAEELRALIDDELAGENTLSVHLTYLRQRIEVKGLTVVANRRLGTYILCRHLHSPYDGRV